MGVWNCVDMGVWQSDCLAIIPCCGRFQSVPAKEGRFKSEINIDGDLQETPGIAGRFGTLICEE